MKKFSLFFLLAVLMAPGVRGDDPFGPMAKLLQDKQYDRLELICRTRLKTNPKSLYSYYFLTMMRMDQGKANEAVPSMLNFAKCHDELEKAQAAKEGKTYKLIVPNFMDLYFLLGEYYVRHQQYDLALPWLLKAKAKYDGDPMLQFFLGRCYAGKKDYDNAIPAFQKESKIDSKDSSALYNIASCYAEQGKEKEAVQWLKKAFTLSPRYKKDVLKDENFKRIKDSKVFRQLTTK